MLHSRIPDDPAAAAHKILIVEDEVIVALDLQRKLTSLGYDIPNPISYGEEVTAAVAAENPDLIVMDIRLKGRMTGLEAGRAVNESSNVPIIFLTAFSDDASLEEAKRINPYAFIQKPVGFENLRLSIDMALYKAGMEQQLSRNEERLNLAVDGASLGIWDWDIETGEIDFNDHWADMLGYRPDEIEPSFDRWKQLLHPDEYSAVMRQLHDHLEGRAPIYQLEHRLRHKTGAWIWVQDSGKIISRDTAGAPVRALGVQQDISRKKRLEQQLQQKIKMEAIGVMSGGIAHNFNNNLAVILGNIEMAQIKKTDPAALEHYLDTAKTAIMSSRELVLQLLTYSSQAIADMIPLPAEAVIKAIRKQVEAILPHAVSLRFDIAPGLETACIEGDAEQLRQVLTNLCSNAVQAMNEQGELIISSALLQVHYDDIPAQYNCCEGTYLRIRVQDAGPGMDDATLAKIFDPFFTTKAVNKGIGMGLSSTQGIVVQHKGFIKVASQPGLGSNFDLYFPTVDSVAGRCTT